MMSDVLIVHHTHLIYAKPPGPKYFITCPICFPSLSILRNWRELSSIEEIMHIYLLLLKVGYINQRKSLSNLCHHVNK